MRYLFKTIKIIALICGLLLLTFVIINWGDEELKPEVLQALDWKAPHNAFEDNGYLILLGIEAPAEMSATQVGTRMLKAELARYVSMQKNHKETPAPEPNPAEVDDYIDWKDNRCDYQKQENCVDFYLQQGADKLVIMLVAQDRLTTRFEAIKQSKNFAEVMPPMLSAQFPKFSPLVNASELERIQAILDMSEGKMEQGVTRLIENSAFSRKLLRESNSLVLHMVAVAMMQRDTRVLSELMVKYPKIAMQYATQLAPVLAPISAPEYSFKKAFKAEGNMVLQTWSHLKYASVAEFAGPNLNVFKRFLSSIGFSPQATTNDAYDLAMLNAKLAEANATQLNAIKAEIEERYADTFQMDYTLFTKKNPVGRILNAVAVPEYANYVERQHDLDGYISIVKLQLNVLVDGLEADKVALRDPYTQKLMQFDHDSGLLTFTGRQPASANVNKSNIYQVKLH